MLLLKFLILDLLFPLIISYKTFGNGNGLKPEEKMKHGFLEKHYLDIGDWLYPREDVITLYRSNLIEDLSQKLRKSFSNTQDCELLKFMKVFALLKYRTFLCQVPYFLVFYARVMQVDSIMLESSHGTLVKGSFHTVWYDVSTEDFVHRLQTCSPIKDRELLQLVSVFVLLKYRTFLCQVPDFIIFYTRVMLVDSISLESSLGTLVKGSFHTVWYDVSTEDRVHRLQQPRPIKNLKLDTLRTFWHFQFHRPRIKFI